MPVLDGVPASNLSGQAIRCFYGKAAEGS